MSLKIYDSDFWTIFKLIEQTFFYIFLRSRFTQEDDQKDEGHNKAFKVAFLSTFLFYFFMGKLWRISKDLITLLISREVF